MIYCVNRKSKSCQLFSHKLNTFLHYERTENPAVTNGHQNHPKLSLTHGGSWPPSSTPFLGQTSLITPKSSLLTSRFHTAMPQISHWFQWATSYPILLPKLPIPVGRSAPHPHCIYLDKPDPILQVQMALKSAQPLFHKSLEVTGQT